MSGVFIFLTIVFVVAAIFAFLASLFFAAEGSWWISIGLVSAAVVIAVFAILSGNYADELIDRDGLQMEQRCIELDGKVIYDEDTLAYSECDLPGESHD